MKKILHFLVLIIATSASAEEIQLLALEYPIRQSTPFRIAENRKDVDLSLPENEAMAYALGIEITKGIGEYFLFDGEHIYANVSLEDHKKIETGIETTGRKLSKKAEAKVQKLIEQKNQKPNKAG